MSSNQITPEWTRDEQRVLKDAQEAAGEHTLSAPEFKQRALALLELGQRVLLRSHNASNKRLRKAAEFERVLVLLAAERLFAGRLLSERLALLNETLERCPQRPALERAALVWMQLEQHHALSHSDDERVRVELARLPRALNQSKVKTLAAYGLSRMLKLEGAQALASEFRSLDMQRRRARIAELVGLLHTYQDATSLGVLVENTYTYLFHGLNAEDRAALVGRLLREISERRASKDAPLHLLLDPLASQNAQNTKILEQIITLVQGIHPGQGERYLLLHVRYAPPAQVRIDVLESLAEHGTRRSLPDLHRLKELPAEFFLFDQLGPVRRAASRAFDAVLAREKLGDAAFGAISVAELGGGELELAATHGELSLMEGTRLDDLPAPRVARLSLFARLLLWLRAWFR